MGQTKATVRQIQGVTLVARGDSNHWVAMDGSPAIGGSAAGSSPKELVLLGLGGCTAFDVISILTKKRAPFTNLEVRLTADVSEEHPRVYTGIHIEYVVTGDGVESAEVERAIELSTTKYCAVTAMLRPSVRITHSHTIVPSGSAPRVPAAQA